MVIIRPEKKEDYAAVYEVNQLAFEQEDEAVLVQKIRNSENFFPELSLVAVKDGRIVGHILFSPVLIKSQKEAVQAIALAPMAVHPEFQNQGIGAALVRQGLEECKRLGHKIVIVVGHPTYYPRFGFSSAKAKGLEAPFSIPDEAFLVLELIPGVLKGIKGRVEYPPAFTEGA